METKEESMMTLAIVLGIVIVVMAVPWKAPKKEEESDAGPK